MIKSFYIEDGMFNDDQDNNCTRINKYLEENDILDYQVISICSTHSYKDSGLNMNRPKGYRVFYRG